MSKGGVKYVYCDYKGIYSAAIGRNYCLYYVKTKYIFFSDIDFIYESNIFGKLEEAIEKLKYFDTQLFISMPIYHLTNKISNTIENSRNIDNYLRTILYDWCLKNDKRIVEFIAPYSNSFLISKDLFNISGGYCEKFVGYGSEDFEYLVRIGIIKGDIPLPKNMYEDIRRPIGSVFWYEPYRGFRKYLEILSKNGEIQGFNAFHLWHPKPKNIGYWIDKNDIKRKVFSEIVKKYYPTTINAIKLDYFRRFADVLCIFSSEVNIYKFMQLRLKGFKLTFIHIDDFFRKNGINQNFLNNYKKIYLLKGDISERIFYKIKKNIMPGILVIYLDNEYDFLEMPSVNGNLDKRFNKKNLFSHNLMEGVNSQCINIFEKNDNFNYSYKNITTAFLIQIYNSILIKLASIFINKNKINKLRSNPERFFFESKSIFSKCFKKLIK